MPDFKGSLLAPAGAREPRLHRRLGGASARSSPALIFAVSVVSIPMILDRQTDAITAGLTSMRLVLHPDRRDAGLGRADRRCSWAGAAALVRRAAGRRTGARPCLLACLPRGSRRLRSIDATGTGASAPVAHRMGDRSQVDVFELAARRHAARQPRDLQATCAQRLASAWAVTSPSAVKLVARMTSSTTPSCARSISRAAPMSPGPTPSSGLMPAHEHEVQTLVAAAALQRRLVGRGLDHAQQPGVATRVEAGAAHRRLGEGVAALAVTHSLDRVGAARAASLRAPSRSCCSRWKAMRCADFTPTPGSRRRASIRPSSEGSDTAAHQNGNFMPGGSGSPAVSLPIFSGAELLGAAHRVVEGGGHQVLEHVLVFGQQAGVDGHALDVVLAGHGHLDQPGAGLAFDLDQRQFFLCALHVVLHGLGLFHQAGELAFHHGRSSLVLFRRV